MQIWSLIVQSNTFNFVIMVIIFIVIFKKCKVLSMLDEVTENTKKTISKAKQTKEKSENELKKANLENETIPSDIKKIEIQGEKNIQLTQQKLKENTEKELENIKLNTKKLIEAKNFTTLSNLSNATVSASVELAKKHVIKLLKENPSFHQELINKSIDEIDKELDEIKL